MNPPMQLTLSADPGPPLKLVPHVFGTLKEKINHAAKTLSSRGDHSKVSGRSGGLSPRNANQTIRPPSIFNRGSTSGPAF